MEAKDIIGYEGLYKIYPDGRIWGYKRKKFLKPSILCGKNNGYLFVALCKEAKQKTTKIHRLLAQHFLDDWDENLMVDHINRIKTDNRLENLRMVTRSINTMNSGVYKTNKSGYKNLFFDKTEKKWVFQTKFNKTRHRKRFKDLDEAIKYRDDFLSNINGKL